MIKLCAVTLLCCALSGCRGTNAERSAALPRADVAVDQPWQKFESSSGGYSISVPGAPIEKSKPKPDKAVRGIPVVEDWRGFVLKAKKGSSLMAYMLDYIDYNSSGVGAYEPYFFLEHCWKESSHPDKEKVIYYRRAKVQGYPALECQIVLRNKPNSALITSQYVLAGRRMYLLTAIMRRPLFGQGLADRFFASFEIRKPPPGTVRQSQARI